MKKRLLALLVLIIIGTTSNHASAQSNVVIWSDVVVTNLPSHEVKLYQVSNTDIIVPVPIKGWSCAVSGPTPVLNNGESRGIVCSNGVNNVISVVSCSAAQRRNNANIAIFSSNNINVGFHIYIECSYLP